MNLAPPSSQKAADRPISFVLDDQSGSGGGDLTSIDLVIRPEELTRTDPSRISVQQTLGGAWADNFGAGLPTITLSGHTGWRRTESDDADGVTRFKNLYDGVFTQWHARRRNAAEEGNDPDKVQLIFADALDDFSVVVAPTSFVLRRSRSRPLLAQFQISLVVVNEDIDSEAYFQYGKGGKLGYLIRGESSASGLLEQLGVTSMTGSLGALGGVLSSVKNVLGGTQGLAKGIMSQVQGFVSIAKNVVGAVKGAIMGVGALARDTLGQVLGLARDVTAAGIGIFRSLAGMVGLDAPTMNFFMQAAGAFSNVYCLLNNAIDQQEFYQDYSDLYGASNCSSTSGGRPISPYAETNPFFDVAPSSDAPPFIVSSLAQNAIASLARVDPVSLVGMLPGSQSVIDLGNRMSQFMDGFDVRDGVQASINQALAA